MGEKKYEREDSLGNKYWEDENGNREYEREDWAGNQYREDQDGNRNYEREDGLGNKYREDENGNREYEREDWVGNKYREDSEGNRTYQREDWLGNTYEKKDDKGGGGCFLSSACIEHAALPDDCSELEILRAFRDEFVAKQPDGRKLITQYYRNAPNIVERIQVSSDREQVLEYIYGKVKEAISRIQGGKTLEALEIYKGLYSEMAARFLNAQS